MSLGFQGIGDKQEVNVLDVREEEEQTSVPFSVPMYFSLNNFTGFCAEFSLIARATNSQGFREKSRQLAVETLLEQHLTVHERRRSN